MTMAETTFVIFVFSFLASFLYADYKNGENEIREFNDTFYTTFCRLVVGLMLINIFLVCRYDVGAITNSFALALAAILCYEMRKMASPGYFCPSNPGDWAIASWEEMKSFPFRLVIYLWGILAVSWYVAVPIFCNFWAVGHLPLLFVYVSLGLLFGLGIGIWEQGLNRREVFKWCLAGFRRCNHSTELNEVSCDDPFHLYYEKMFRVVRDSLDFVSLGVILCVIGLGIGDILLSHRWLFELTLVAVLAIGLGNSMTICDYQKKRHEVAASSQFWKGQAASLAGASILLLFFVGLWFEILTKIFVF